MEEKRLLELFGEAYEYLNRKGVHEIRNLARAVGVKAPTEKSKHVLICGIIGLAAGLEAPEQCSRRGARVKAEAVSAESVAELQEVIDKCKRGITYGNDFAEPEKNIFCDSEASLPKYGYADAVLTGVLEDWGRGEWRLCTRQGGAIAVSEELVRQYGLREGDCIGVYTAEENGAVRAVQVAAVEGNPPVRAERRRFEDLAAGYPTERFLLSASGDGLLRAADVLCPLGKGQRALVIGGPETGKTTLLRRLAESVNGQAKIVFLMLGQRPEESGEIVSAVPDALVLSAAFDSSFSRQMRLAKTAWERAKRIAESGGDALLLVDSLNALLTAAEKTFPNADEGVLECKKMFASARSADRGSLTVAATLAEEEGGATVPKAAAEFVTAANSAIRLTKSVAEEGIVPAIDFSKSFTKRAESLLSERERAKAQELRNALAEGGTRGVLEKVKNTEE